MNIKSHSLRIAYFPVLLLLIITMNITPAFAQSEISGIVYSPTKKNAFFEDIIKDDISTISSFTDSVRLYKIEDSTQKILENAKMNHIKIVLGVDLDSDDNKIKDDLQKAVQFVQDYPETVDSVVVGNDAIALKQITLDKLQEYLMFFKSNGVIVSSANSPHIWQDNPSLAANVDYILLYSFDFWDGLDAEQAARNAILQYNNLQKLFPDKSIILETGWPSDGEYLDDAIPTEHEQSKYLKSFINLANQRNISYYIFAYADESWKPAKNGNTVENNWGMLFEETRIVKSHLVDVFVFEAVRYAVEIDANGQAHYKPNVSDMESNVTNKILKVSIPENISFISYVIYDQEKLIQTDGKQTILFVQTSYHDYDDDTIAITTDKYSDKVEFSLIPQAFAACDVDAVCYNVNYDNSSNDNLLVIIILSSIMLGVVSVIIYIRHIPRSKEWDSLHIQALN